MSQTPLMVFIESATVVTELPKVATTLLPGCERKSLTTWWRCIGDLLQHCHNSWRLTGNSFTMLATTATLGDLAIFLNSLKKLPSISVVWQPLTMEGNVLATSSRSLTIRAMWRQFPATIGCQHVASTISASVKGADRLADRLAAIFSSGVTSWSNAPPGYITIPIKCRPHLTPKAAQYGHEYLRKVPLTYNCRNPGGLMKLFFISDQTNLL